MRIPASANIKKEMTGWSKYDNIIPLFWPTTMAREPVIRAYAEDLLNWVGSSSSEKQVQTDWYDSHIDPEFLTTLKAKGNIITMFYPNKCTDILATCDGGLIKTIQDRFRKNVEVMLENHFDRMMATDALSRKIQRDFILKTMNDAIATVTTESVRKAATKCGALFDLRPSLEEQFKGACLRGYTVDGAGEAISVDSFRYKNIFEGADVTKSVELRKLWAKKEQQRCRDNAEELKNKKLKKKNKKPKQKKKIQKKGKKPQG